MVKMATMIPDMKPKNIDANVFAISSYTIILVICCLVQPMDLRMPNSQDESLMFAVNVMISWNEPRVKQIALQSTLKNWSSLHRSCYSTFCFSISMTRNLASSRAARTVFCTCIRSMGVAPSTILMNSASF